MRWPWVRRYLLDNSTTALQFAESVLSDREREIDTLNNAFTTETHRRVAAETVASSLNAELTRLREDYHQLQSDYRALTTERLKSVDALNVRLMEPRVADTPPDFGKLKMEAVGKVRDQVVNRVRKLNRDMDLAMLAHMHPGFSHLKDVLEKRNPLASTTDSVTEPPAV